MNNYPNMWAHLFMDKGMCSVVSDTWLHTVTHSFLFVGNQDKINHGSIIKSILLTVA